MSQDQILDALQSGPKSANQLIALTNLSYKAVKRALQTLEALGEVRGRRDVCPDCGTVLKKWEIVGYKY